MTLEELRERLRVAEYFHLVWDVAEDAITYAEQLQRSRDWSQRRCSVLQTIQKDMRDPERKAVCDVLANGETYVTLGEEPDIEQLQMKHDMWENMYMLCNEREEQLKRERDEALSFVREMLLESAGITLAVVDVRRRALDYLARIEGGQDE